MIKYVLTILERTSGIFVTEGAAMGPTDSGYVFRVNCKTTTTDSIIDYYVIYVNLNFTYWHMTEFYDPDIQNKFGKITRHATQVEREQLQARLYDGIYSNRSKSHKLISAKKYL